MTTLAEHIAQANTRLQTARNNNDTQAEAVAQAELNTLNSIQSEGYVPQSEANNGAGTARDEGRNAGTNAERQRLSQQLGVGVDKLDEELQRLSNERRNQQSEAQRLQGDLSSVTQQRDTLTTERDAATSERDSVRQALETARIDQALERELLKQGVIHGEEQSHLGHALTLTDRSKVSVTRDDKGAITGITGADAAAKATRESVPALFTGGQLGGVGGTPKGQRQSGTQQSGSRPAYKGKYSTPQAASS